MFEQFFAIVFVFFSLVMIHELGHFFAAKLMGVRVEKFSIGFAPTVYSFQYGETEYAIGMIPLGGYVKMSGMIDEGLKTDLKGDPFEFDSKSSLAKIFILSAGVIMNTIMAITIFWAIFFFQGKTVHEAFIGRVQPNSIASAIGLQPNDFIVGVNDEDLASYEDFLGRFMEIFQGGSILWVERDQKRIGLEIESDLLEKYPPVSSGFGLRRETIIAYIDSTMPAGKIRLKSGDKIVAVNSDSVDYWYQLDPLIRPNPGKKIMLSWLREGQVMSDSLIIATIEYEGEDGFLDKYGQIGVGFAALKSSRVKIDFFDAWGEAVSESIQFLNQNIIGLSMMITGKTKAEDSVGGIITIAAVTGAVAETGFVNLLMLLAQLSLILAFFNILPLPVLDGGHIVIVLFEAIRRKPLSAKIKLNIQKYGMIFLLLLVVAVFYIDIKRFFG